MPPLVKLAIGQFRPRKGDYAHNLARIGDVLEQAAAIDPAPQVLHLPETALSGYFVEGGVRELAVPAGLLAEQLNELFRSRVRGAKTMDVVVGFYEEWNSTLYNSLMCVSLGAAAPVVRHVHRKLFLPTYTLFDEERFVERGHRVRAFDTSWGRAALLVCEDAWHSLTGTIAALDGAQFILLSSAAPARGTWPRSDDTPGPYTLNRWERLARDIAEEHGVFVSLAHLVGSEAGKTFAGGSVVVGPRGDVLVRAPLFDEALVTVVADPADMTRARADSPLLSDLETMLPHLLENVQSIRDGRSGARQAPQQEQPEGWTLTGARERSARASDAGKESTGGVRQRASLLPLVSAGIEPAGGPPPLRIDPELTARFLTSFIRSELQQRGFSRAVVGVSGGVDSAVTATLAATALGAENVLGVRMPYRASSPESAEHAQLLIDQLGIQCRTVDITGAVDGYLQHEPDADATRRGNVMARVRMIVLFDLSAAKGALPLGTGNKSERLLGYFTWHADDSPPVNPIGDLYKTQVWELARHLGVPEAIVGKPATADLVQGQTDEGDLGISYERADELLNWLLSGYSATELCRRGFSEQDIDIVASRLARTHWKRRLPTVAMLSPSAIGESYLRPVDY